MNVTFACGRCAHQFGVPETDTKTSAVCPQCGFHHCYMLGVLSTRKTDDAGAKPARPSDAQTAETGGADQPEPSEEFAPATGLEGPSAAETTNLRPEQATIIRHAARPPSVRKTAIRAVVVIVAMVVFLIVGLAVYWARYGTDRDGAPDANSPPSGQPGTTRSHPATGDAPATGAPLPQPKVARSLEEAKHAVVEFVMPMGVGNLNQYGTGFLIDERGWVATNDHVIERATTDARVEMADGKKLEIEGILARATQHDLAIVKLRDPPAGLTLLDIGYEGDLALGQDVFAFGHPYDAAFSLSKGIVSRILSTREWLHRSPRVPLAQQRFPDDMIWIQHDAKLSPGNSGGPLLDEQGHVFGMNTFVHVKAEFGYASHVRYLRELLASASDSVVPLPEAREALKTAVSSQKILSLFATGSACQWQPRTAQQYESLAELAQQMTLAKHAALAQSQTTQQQSEVIRRVGEVADRQFAELRKLTWTALQLGSLAQFADGLFDNAGGGVFVYGSVLGTLPQQNALLMKVEGTDDLIVLRGGAQLARMPRNARCLVLGFILPQHVKVQDEARSVTRQAPVVLTYHVLPLQAGN